MTAKRALVVDDSKSARAFLANLLVKNAIEVDAAESAEQAIEYLSRHRPDVIFMDHLMPGMDGFQAVQVIKSNPQTATIPVLMYTSQEGELYVGQARALGAVGVLPKKVEPADVTKVLQQLHLTLDSAATAQDSTHVKLAVLDESASAANETMPATAHSDVDTQMMPAASVFSAVPLGQLEQMLEEERRTLRESLDAAIERQQLRWNSELRTALRDAVPAPVEPARPASAWLPWSLAAAASIAAAALSALLWNARQQNTEFASSVQLLEGRAARSEAAAREAQIRLAEVTAALPPQGPLRTDASLARALTGTAVLTVPFNEAPLAGDRIAELKSLVASLAAGNHKGRLEIRHYAGRFCLSGDRNSSQTLTEASRLQGECSTVATPALAGVLAGPPESVEFANALIQMRRAHGQAIQIDVAAGHDADTVRIYPETAGEAASKLTAGEWNAVAEANNRVEFRWHPAS